LQLQNAEDVDNIRLPANFDQRPASADAGPYRQKIETGAESADGPRVTVTDRPSRPFTELVRLQRPALMRQNRERVRAKAAAAKSVPSDATVNADQRLPSAGKHLPLLSPQKLHSSSKLNQESNLRSCCSNGIDTAIAATTEIDPLYSPGGANVYPLLIRVHGPLGPRECAPHHTFTDLVRLQRPALKADSL